MATMMPVACRENPLSACSNEGSHTMNAVPTVKRTNWSALHTHMTGMLQYARRLPQSDVLRRAAARFLTRELAEHECSNDAEQRERDEREPPADEIHAAWRCERDEHRADHRGGREQAHCRGAAVSREPRGEQRDARREQQRTKDPRDELIDDGDPEERA